jgi:hypothetical protein
MSRLFSDCFQKMQVRMPRGKTDFFVRNLEIQDKKINACLKDETTQIMELTVLGLALAKQSEL